MYRHHQYFNGSKKSLMLKFFVLTTASIARITDKFPGTELNRAAHVYKSKPESSDILHRSINNSLQSNNICVIQMHSPKIIPHRAENSNVTYRIEFLNQYLIQSDLSRKSSLNGSTIDLSDYSGALFYIIFVLMFYSFGIVIMMAKYMKREQKEYQEAKKYQRYVKTAREFYMQSISRSRATNKLALQAFNTINLIPQIVNSKNRPKITYV
ncbi:unnamed protein product [Gordionus sp. m RMFG-2023]|uniref:uncharacterized protein LOC135924754 n=1 Tax=Gordionus sp. m RMFG-2023 TaxID=3053472 RepID=UPI0030E360F1